MSAQAGRMVSLKGSYYQCGQEDEDQVVLDRGEAESGGGGGCWGESEGRRGARGD